MSVRRGIAGRESTPGRGRPAAVGGGRRAAGQARPRVGGGGRAGAPLLRDPFDSLRSLRAGGAAISVKETAGRASVSARRVADGSRGEDRERPRLRRPPERSPGPPGDRSSFFGRPPPASSFAGYIEHVVPRGRVRPRLRRPPDRSPGPPLTDLGSARAPSRAVARRAVGGHEATSRFEDSLYLVVPSGAKRSRGTWVVGTLAQPRGTASLQSRAS
jgi:hypothetical protein